MMRKLYISLAILLCTVAPAAAQYDTGKVRIHDPEIAKEGESVTVAFRAEVGDKAVKRNYSLVFAPVLTDGTYTWSLPAIVVRGRGTRIVETRHLMASGRLVNYNDARYTTNGSTVDYRAEIPYQRWMEDARLVMEAVNVGCCSTSPLSQRVMVERLALSPPVVVEPVLPPVTVPVLSTADRLAENNSFIRPYTEYDGQVYDDDRRNALIITFRQGKHDVVPDFADNLRSLSRLIASVQAIRNSSDSRVRKVMIAGFASPEGTFELNDRLAWNRAVTLKNYLVEHAGLDPDLVQLYNGSEDWHGLRLLVSASDMYQRQAVLDIIDHTPLDGTQGRNSRLNELKRLDGGIPYRYMYDHFFPQLRNAAYIKVYYDNSKE